MRFVVIVWFVSLSMSVHGQGNLVPNCGFEEYSSCGLNGFFQIWLAAPWNNSGPICSPDYFHECSPLTANGLPKSGVPENTRGYQHARSGVAYGGFFAYEHNNNSGREFVQVELMEPIVAGVRYEVVFHVSLADKYLHAVSTLGAHFSDTQIVRSNYSIAELALIPQVSSAEGMVFDDKENWTEVRDTFDSRYGGERFITIGNFNLDDESGVVLLDSGERVHAYYYIDDVSVIALDSIPNSVAEPEHGQRGFTVFPNPNNGQMTLTYELSGNDNGVLEIYDMLGKRIYSLQLKSSTRMVSIELNSVGSGMYSARVLVNGAPRFFQKINVLKQ